MRELLQLKVSIPPGNVHAVNNVLNDVKVPAHFMFPMPFMPCAANVSQSYSRSYIRTSFFFALGRHVSLSTERLWRHSITTHGGQWRGKCFGSDIKVLHKSHNHEFIVNSLVQPHLYTLTG